MDRKEASRLAAKKGAATTNRIKQLKKEGFSHETARELARGESNVINLLLHSIRKALETYSIEDLMKLLQAHREYFGEEEDEYGWVETGGKKCIIDFIVNTDPIMAEGGLVDFLADLKRKGEGIKWSGN